MPHRAFHDAVMIGFSERLSDAEAIKQRAAQIVDETKILFQSNPRGTFTGQGNTKQDIKSRINLFRQMLSNIVP